VEPTKAVNRIIIGATLECAVSCVQMPAVGQIVSHLKDHVKGPSRAAGKAVEIEDGGPTARFDINRYYLLICPFMSTIVLWGTMIIIISVEKNCSLSKSEHEASLHVKWIMQLKE